MNPNQKQIAGISLNIIEPRAEMGEKKMRSNIKTKQHIKYQNIKISWNIVTTKLLMTFRSSNITKMGQLLGEISNGSLGLTSPQFAPQTAPVKIGFQFIHRVRFEIKFLAIC
jgi:hypothetical protein